MAYSDADKAMAVEIVARNKGVVDTVCLADIQNAIGKAVTVPSVRLWVKQFTGTLPEEKKKNFPEKKVQDLKGIQQVAAKKLDEKLEQAAHKFVDRATEEDVVNKMNGQQAMTSAAIAIDKMRLLRDLPTEIIGVLPVLTKLNDALSKHGQSLGDALEVWLKEYVASTEQVQNNADFDDFQGGR